MWFPYELYGLDTTAGIYLLPYIHFHTILFVILHSVAIQYREILSQHSVLSSQIQFNLTFMILSELSLLTHGINPSDGILHWNELGKVLDQTWWIILWPVFMFSSEHPLAGYQVKTSFDLMSDSFDGSVQGCCLNR